jgi:hypothetical protein
VDALDHSLNKPDEPDTAKDGIKLYERFVSSDAVLAAAEECCDRILDLYAEPKRAMAEIFTTLHSGELEVFKRFSDACRVELRKYSIY